MMCVVALVALDCAMGCADLLGADFDVHRASHPESDAGARDSDFGAADRSEAPPKGSDASGDPRTSPEAALHPPDGVAPDVGNAGQNDGGSLVDSDASDGDARGDDGRDVEDDDRHIFDASEGGDWPLEGGAPDAGKGGSNRDVGVGDPADGADATSSIDAGGEPPPDAPRSTGFTGGFVSLGVPGGTSSSIELRGHFIPNTVMRGVTSSGLTIEGKIQ